MSELGWIEYSFFPEVGYLPEPLTPPQHWYLALTIAWIKISFYSISLSPSLLSLSSHFLSNSTTTTFPLLILEKLSQQEDASKFLANISLVLKIPHPKYIRCSRKRPPVRKKDIPTQHILHPVIQLSALSWNPWHPLVNCILIGWNLESINKTISTTFTWGLYQVSAFCSRPHNEDQVLWIHWGGGQIV